MTQHPYTTGSAEFQSFHKFRADDGTEYGSFEVFHEGNSDPLLKSGWYWWKRHPGFIAESDQHGPFPTAEGAYLDALEGPKHKVEDLLGYPDGINFLDEVPSVLEDPDGPEIMQAVNQLVLDRRLSNYQLPDGSLDADAIKNSNTLEAQLLAKKLMES